MNLLKRRMLTLEQIISFENCLLDLDEVMCFLVLMGMIYYQVLFYIYLLSLPFWLSLQIHRQTLMEEFYLD